MDNQTVTEGLELSRDQKSYYKWMFDEIKPYLKETILEIGSGIGTISEKLYNHSRGKIIFSDISENYLKLLKKKFPHVDIIKLDLEKTEIKNFKKYNINTVVCINVLEHIQDDIPALLKIYKLLSKSGKLVLLVPAHKFLYNTLDQEINHHRRYSKKELILKLRKSGFVIKKIKFFNFFGMFGWFFYGNILKKRMIGKKGFGLLNKIIPLLRFIEKYLLFNVTGISIIAVGEKIKR